MRQGTVIGLCSAAALGVACLSAASVEGAGADGLTDTSMMSGAEFSGAFSGGYASDRVPDDPDAPIRTARYDQAPLTAPSTVELAGAPPIVEEAVMARAAPVSPEEVQASLALAEARSGPRRSPSAAAMALAGGPDGEIDHQALVARTAGAPPPSRLAVSVTTGETPFAPGSGLNFAVREDDSPAAIRIPQRTRLFDARRWGLTFDLSPQESRKGRWYVFAATSGDAFGFNLFGDPAKSGEKRNRWSVEKLAEYGKAQLGIGWRKGPTQVSVAATRREIGAYGYSREDTVFGVSFTISGGKRLPAPKTRRGLPRE